MNSEDFIHAVKELFKPSILCKINREFISMLYELPKEMDLSTTQFTPNAGSFGNGVIRTESCSNMEGIIEMLYNIPRVTMDEQTYTELNLIRPEETYLSISQIADLIEKRAYLYIVNPKDTVAVVDKIRIYLNMVADYSLYDLHYQKPPEKDMESFRKLKTMLQPIADAYLNKGATNSTLSALLGLVMPTASKHSAEQMVALNGANNSFTIADSYGKHSDPFKFSNFV